MQVPQKTQVQSLGQEDPLEEEMATHSSILAGIIPGRGAWQAPGQKELDMAEWLSKSKNKRTD